MSAFDTRRFAIDVNMHRDVQWGVCDPNQEVLYGFHGPNWMPYIHDTTAQPQISSQNEYAEKGGVEPISPYAHDELVSTSAHCGDVNHSETPPGYQHLDGHYDTYNQTNQTTPHYGDRDGSIYRSDGAFYNNSREYSAAQPIRPVYDRATRIQQSQERSSFTLSDEYRASIARHSNEFHASSVSQLYGLGGGSGVHQPVPNRSQSYPKPHENNDNNANYDYQGNSNVPNATLPWNTINYDSVSKQNGFNSALASGTSLYHAGTSATYEPLYARNQSFAQSIPNPPPSRSSATLSPQSSPDSDSRHNLPLSRSLPTRDTTTHVAAIPRRDQPFNAATTPQPRPPQIESRHEHTPHDTLRQQEPWTPLPWPGSSQSVLKLNPIKKKAEKKQALACLFCRERKIACGRPDPSSEDPTCNQCARRQIDCEYPKESRRGQHKRRRKAHDVNDAEPQCYSDGMAH